MSSGRGLHSAFFRHARLTPGAVAFTVGGRPTTYGDAAESALRMAGAVTDALGRPALRVGILGAKSATAYEGALAALAMGGCFVPLNPSFPAERTREMMLRADLDAIIADAAGARRLRAVLSGLISAPVVVIPEEDAPAAPPAWTIGRRGVASARPLAAPATVAPSDLAYIIFTSGSTGSPKGVPLTHGGAVSFLDATLALARLTPDDRVTQGTEPTFDLSMSETFLPWEAGARACTLATEELLAPARALARDGVTTWVSTPSRVAHLRRRGLLAPGSLAGIRLALFCGEPLPAASFEAWQAAAPGCESWNFYGPTEATVWCTAHRCDATTSAQQCVNGILPIGMAMAGTRVSIVDEQLRPVASGDEGELCLAGVQLTPGYWRAPALTRAAFFEAPDADGTPSRWYRTGDRARVLPSGELMHLGRLDAQVKVQGYRVELGEVEHVLREAAPGLSEVAVVGWPWRDGSAEGLVAFGSGETSGFPELRDALRARLPAWATPSRLVLLDHLPRNTSGKVDRLALREMLRAGAAA